MREQLNEVPKYTYTVRTDFGSFNFATRTGYEGCKQTAMKMYPMIHNPDAEIHVSLIGSVIL